MVDDVMESNGLEWYCSKNECPALFSDVILDLKLQSLSETLQSQILGYFKVLGGFISVRDMWILQEKPFAAGKLGTQQSSMVALVHFANKVKQKGLQWIVYYLNLEKNSNIHFTSICLFVCLFITHSTHWSCVIIITPSNPVELISKPAIRTQSSNAAAHYKVQTARPVCSRWAVIPVVSPGQNQSSEAEPKNPAGCSEWSILALVLKHLLPLVLWTLAFIKSLYSPP